MTTPVFFPRPSTLTLAAALLAGAAAPALAHGPKPHAEGGIASTPSKAVKAPFDIVHTRITTEGRTAVFHIGVSGKAGALKAAVKWGIGVDNVVGAQLFGDSAIELTMRDGRRYRMFFSRECQALSFYQGFYYRRLKAGQLCAGRDVIGARSGGECPIASIIPVRKFKKQR